MSTGKKSIRLTEEQRRTVEANMGLVYHVVYGMINSGRLREGLKNDAVQEGMLGLMNASVYYEPEKGNAFSTLAVSCIRQKVAGLMRKEYYRENRAAFSLDEAVGDGEGKAEDRLWAEAIAAEDDTERDGMSSLVDVCCQLLEKTGRHKNAEVLRAYAMEDKKMTEIAREMGVTKQCVQQRMRAAGRVLNEVLTNEDDWRI